MATGPHVWTPDQQLTILRVIAPQLVDTSQGHPDRSGGGATCVLGLGVLGLAKLGLGTTNKYGGGGGGGGGVISR